MMGWIGCKCPLIFNFSILFFKFSKESALIDGRFFQNNLTMNNTNEKKKRCFVTMGFGVKTDYATGRNLDLNKTYRLLIKPVVEELGIECVRADEIIHSGSIDVPIFSELADADLVIADLSTTNANAIYE